jgi:hypothetical protein
VTRKAGLLVPGKHWGSGCAWIDYNRDGLLDLFVTSYLEFDPARIPNPGAGPYRNWHGVPVNCGPPGLPPGRNWLYRNNGDGAFIDVTTESGIGKVHSGYGLTAAAADFDNDRIEIESLRHRFARHGAIGRQAASIRSDGSGAACTSVWETLPKRMLRSVGPVAP